MSPDLVVTSTLQRTAQTAEAMGVRADYADADLAEMSLGAWEGRVIPELHEEDPEQYWAWRSGQLTPPGAETFDELCVRVERALARVVARLDGAGLQRALVVCHGGVLRASIKVLTGIDPGSLMPIDPGSATIVQLRDLGGAGSAAGVGATAASNCGSSEGSMSGNASIESVQSLDRSRWDARLQRMNWVPAERL